MAGRSRGSRADTGDYKRELGRATRRARRDDLKPSVGAIAFFDLPGSTRVMKKDPHAAVPRMILHNSLCGAIVRLDEGTVVKELGDGLVVRFTNAGDAVVCAADRSEAFACPATASYAYPGRAIAGGAQQAGARCDWSGAASPDAADRPPPPRPFSTAGRPSHL